jgi:hypothetical protein
MKYMSGGTMNFGSNIITAILNDGTLVEFDAWTINSAAQFGINYPNNSTYLSIFADINGSKKPNTFGKDIFVFIWIPYIGLMPAYKDRTETQRNADCNKTGSGYGCIYKYLKD